MSAPSLAAADLLYRWLARQLSPEAQGWLEAQREKLQADPSDRQLYLSVSLAQRKVGKADLDLGAEDFEAAASVRAGWRPVGWSVDQAARLALALTIAAAAPERFPQRMEQLFRTADVGELVAFYRGLPLYPQPEAFVARAAEGCRTNMRAVFEGVSHHNPYPAERFDEVAWNHMVLKSIFIGSPLYLIHGLDDRQNPELTRMLCDYAHERWAASRTITPELWRCTSRHATDDTLNDLKRVLDTGDATERRAAALTLSTSPHPGAGALLQTAPELVDELETGSLSWASLVRDAGLA